MDELWKERMDELEKGIDSVIPNSINKDIMEMMKKLLNDTKVQNSIKEYYNKTTKEDSKK